MHGRISQQTFAAGRQENSPLSALEHKYTAVKSDTLREVNSEKEWPQKGVQEFSDQQTH